MTARPQRRARPKQARLDVRLPVHVLEAIDAIARIGRVRRNTVLTVIVATAIWQHRQAQAKASRA